MARGEGRLRELAGELAAEYGARAQVVPVDLSQPAGPGEIMEALAQQHIEVDVLVNNAGFGAHGSVAGIGVARQLDMIEVNVAALTRLTAGERTWQGRVVMRSHACCHCGWRSAGRGMYQRRRPVLRQVCALTGALWKLPDRGDAGKHATDAAVTPGDLGPRLRRTRGSSDTEANAGWQETNERKAAKGLSGPMLELRESGSVRRWLADDVPRL